MAFGILSFLYLVTFLSSTATAICYFPDGTPTNQDSACFPDQVAAGGASFCCGPGYACASNRLCEAVFSLTGNVNFTRGSCTDKTWSSQDCPNFCLDSPSVAVGVDQCGAPNADRFCCTTHIDACNCSNPDSGGNGIIDFFSSFTIVTTIGVAGSTSAASSTTSSVTTSSTIVSTSSTSSSSSAPSSQSVPAASSSQSTKILAASTSDTTSLLSSASQVAPTTVSASANSSASATMSSGVLAGIVVGPLLVLLLSVVLIYIALRRRSDRHTRKPVRISSPPVSFRGVRSSHDHKYIYEKSARSKPTEIGDGRSQDPVELSAIGTPNHGYL